MLTKILDWLMDRIFGENPSPETFVIRYFIIVIGAIILGAAIILLG